MNYKETSDLTLATDGAFSSSRNQMGIGIVILEEDKIIKEFSHGYKGGTNNKAEIAAVILGLRFLTKPFNTLTIITDSQLVIGQLSKNWKRNKNISLLKEADKQLARVSKLCSSIEFKHVKGHNGDPINTRCDMLAVMGSKADL